MFRSFRNTYDALCRISMQILNTFPPPATRFLEIVIYNVPSRFRELLEKIMLIKKTHLQTYLECQREQGR